MAHAHARRDAVEPWVTAQRAEILVPCTGSRAAVLPERLPRVALQRPLQIEHALLDELHHQPCDEGAGRTRVIGGAGNERCKQSAR